VFFFWDLRCADSQAFAPQFRRAAELVELREPTLGAMGYMYHGIYVYICTYILYYVYIYMIMIMIMCIYDYVYVYVYVYDYVCIYIYV
jgi:hypothetical protein